MTRPGRLRSNRRHGGPDLLGAGLVGLMSLLFGAVVVLGKLLVNSHLAVASLLAFRFLLAGVVLAVVLAVLRLPLRAAEGEGWKLAGLGVATYAIESTLFFSALGHGTAPAVTLLFFTYPVIVALLSLASGKGLPGTLVMLSLVAALGGAALVILAGGRAQIDAAGVALSLGSAFAFSLYLTGADRVLKATNSLVGAMWVSAAAGTALGVYALVSGTGQLPDGWRQWGPVLGMAGFTAAAFVCLFAGLRRLGAVRTSVVAATEPLAASVLAILFLGEHVGPGLVLGGVLILAGAVAASLARREVPAEPPVP